MRSDTHHMPGGIPPPPPKAVNTYFGQFVVHDLTRDDTPLSDSPLPDPSNILNHRTGFLDLDSIYGAGPCSEDSCLYESDDASFKLGAVRTRDGELFDVPVEGSKVLIADDRNNENLIIRQIHAIFLKLHNIAIDELRGRISEDMIFHQARERVRWQYQWLVRQDYLSNVCKIEIYNQVITNGCTQIDWSNPFAIPVEFAHAAGRFGHSMVRPEYNLNRDNIGLNVREIFSRAPQHRPLDPSFAIDWHMFTRQPSNSIDTKIITALYELSFHSIKPFVANLTSTEPSELPIRTLYRSIMMQVATGQSARAFLDPDAKLPSEGLDPTDDELKCLRQLGLLDQTPLWYYVLLEAEKQEHGATLGIIGSRIIGEVIEGALRADQDSFLHQLDRNPKWHPAPWKTPQGDYIPIDDFLDLAIVVGLANRRSA